MNHGSALLASCLTLFMLLDDVSLYSLNDPTFSQSYLGAHMSNLRCAQADISHAELSVVPSSLSLNVSEPSFVNCTMQLDFWSYHGDLEFTAEVQQPNGIVIERTLNESVDGSGGRLSGCLGGHRRRRSGAETSGGCYSNSTEVLACDVDVTVSHLQVNPPSTVLDAFLDSIRSYLQSYITSKVCTEAVPGLQALLANHTVEPPSPLPVPVRGATPLQESPLFRAARNIAAAFPPLFYVALSFQLVSNNTARFAMTFTKGKDLHFDGSVNEPRGRSGVWRDVQLPREAPQLVYHILKTTHQKMNLLVPHVKNHFTRGDFRAVFPPGSGVTADVSFTDLACVPDTYACSVSVDGGVLLSNIRLTEDGDLGVVVTNTVGPKVAQLANDYIRDLLNHSNYVTSEGRFNIPMREKLQAATSPSAWVVVTYLVASTAVAAAAIRRNVDAHEQCPIFDVASGEALARQRLVVEDALLCAGLCLCGLGFLWSNLTTGATLVVGDELVVSVFSLMSTVRDLWHAGLYPLSVCVFLFSGVYPYAKLMAILLFTVVLHRPDSATLHAIDYFGKFSFIDTFVMLIMVGGLEIRGIADVHIGASFYLFAFSTAGSIALGNAAVHLWRAGTNERHTSSLEPLSDADSADEDGGAAVPLLRMLGVVDEDGAVIDGDEAAGDAEEGRGDWRAPLRRFAHKTLTSEAAHHLYRLRRPLGMLLLLAPAWLWPCLTYTVGGVGPLVSEPEMGYTLAALSSGAGATCVIITFATVFVAPLLYVTFPKRLSFLSSWSASDVLLLSCFAGLVQLNQFIQFVLGPGMGDFYSARTTMHWPLFLLLIAAGWVWYEAAAALLSSLRASSDTDEE